ncbi:hypothetical protein MRF4_15070 [Methylobacterium radiotolerans]
MRLWQPGRFILASETRGAVSCLGAEMLLPNAGREAKSSARDNSRVPVEFDLDGRVTTADASTSLDGRGHE